MEIMVPKQGVYKQEAYRNRVFQDRSDGKTASQTHKKKTNSMLLENSLSDLQNNKGTLVPSTKGAVGGNKDISAREAVRSRVLFQAKLLVVGMGNKLFSMQPLPTVSLPGGM